ncbi:hypothetical protein JCM19233_6416 [Vibrio astriarenae]|nr:hypothetical protein JCM19233_6416 [Vibrio sp. C7]
MLVRLRGIKKCSLAIDDIAISTNKAIKGAKVAQLTDFSLSKIDVD